LGCGTGELTHELHRRLRARTTLGIDSSPAMLERAAAYSGDGLRFELANITGFAAREAYDLVFSNAALHWLPDQEELLGRLTGAIRPGGQLAVQVPANHDHPSHVVAAEVAEHFGIAGRRSPVLAPEAYAAVLDRLGCPEQHVRLQVYVHHLASRDDVVEWVKGSLLTDYQKRLPAERFDEFLARYRERLLPQLSDARPYLFTFERILFWARRRA